MRLVNHNNTASDSSHSQNFITQLGTWEHTQGHIAKGNRNNIHSTFFCLSCLCPCHYHSVWESLLSKCDNLYPTVNQSPLWISPSSLFCHWKGINNYQGKTVRELDSEIQNKSVLLWGFVTQYICKKSQVHSLSKGRPKNISINW